AAGLAGVAALLLGNGGDPVALIYFSVQSNALLAAVHLASAAAPGRIPPAARGGATLYLLITGSVYHLVLVNPASPFFVGAANQGSARSLLLHTVAPLLALAEWLLVTGREGRHPWSAAVRWLSYPLAYFAFVLVWGGTGRGYPYPFVDADRLGYGTVAVNAAVLTAVFYVLGLALLGAGRASRAALARLTIS
ncbi:MAG TPA: Pr6Pr family membrane protein, partial [Pilimelia sp.]|nr:Pr6Pr family membrane protein [Pilimelia sp.]